MLNFASGTTSAGKSAIFRLVIRLPKVSTLSTMHLKAVPSTFGLGMLNRVKSSMGSPNAAVCQDLESQAAHGAKMSRPWNVLLTGLRK